MAKIKKLKQNNEDLYPITHEDAVFDSDGVNIGTKINNLEDDMINLVDVGEIEDIENGYAQIEMEVLENVKDTVNINGRSILFKEIRGNSTVENNIIKTVENKDGLTLSITNPDNLFYFDNVGYNDGIFEIDGPNSINVSATSGRGRYISSNLFIKIKPHTGYIICYDSIINEVNTCAVRCFDENYNILNNLQGIGTYVATYNAYIQTKNVKYIYDDKVAYIQLGFRSYPLSDDLSIDSNVLLEDNNFYSIFNIGIYEADSINDITRVKYNTVNIPLNYINNNRCEKIYNLNKINDNIYDKIYYNNIDTLYEKNCELYEFKGTEKIIEGEDLVSDENVVSFYILINKRISLLEEISDDKHMLCNYFNYIDNLSEKNVVGIDYLSGTQIRDNIQGLNVCRGVCLHINKSELNEISVNGMREKLKDWYNEGKPLTIVAKCDKEIFNMQNLVCNTVAENINININSKSITPEFDICLGKIKSNTTIIHDLNDYATLHNMIILSDEMKKTGKNIQEILNENKRVIVDKKFYIDYTIKLTGSGYKLLGIGEGTGFYQICKDKPVFELGEEDNPLTSTTMSDFTIMGVINILPSLQTDHLNDGILINFAYGITLKNLFIRYNDGYGIRCKNESGGNGLWITKFVDCTIDYNYWGGVKFNHSNGTQFNDITFDRCRIAGNGWYIDDDGIHKLAYIDKVVLEDYGHGMDISGTAVRAVCCVIEGNGGIGIKINNGYAHGICLTGIYFEPNLLTNIYICKDGYKKDIFINGNYFLQPEDRYNKGLYYIEDGFDMKKLYGTQLYDYTDVINTSKSPIPIIVEDGTKYCIISLTEKMLNHPLNFKLTMRYKSLIEHGYMSFGIQYQCKEKMLNILFNKDTKKSNVVNITNVSDNIVTIDTPLIPTDDTWDHITFHNHTDHPEHDYNGGFLTGVKDFVISKENLNYYISDNGLKLTFNNLSSDNLNMLKNCTHITYHKKDTSFKTSTDWMMNYVQIPVSLDRYNNVVMFNSMMEMEKYSEARLHIDKFSVWGLPISSYSGNHEMIDLRIEQNDTACVWDTNELDMLIKYNQMRIYIYNKCIYVTYYNGKYYKDDGTVLTI
jgi:hypothetical protein